MLVAAGLFNAASAQSRDGRYNNQDRYPVNQQNDNWNQNGQQQSRDGRYNNQDRYPAHQQNDNWNQNGQQQSRDYGYNDSRGRNNDYQRQAEYDRMNQQYDQRVNDYRNDRRLNRYERNRRIQQAEYERQQKAKSFGTGLVVGGIAAIVLGVLFSHGN